MTASKWEQALQERRLPRSESRDGDHRNPYQRDKARVLHSAAFRRLQAKTQVLGVGLSDFYRTRLTHSLEAAQIGTGITAQLCVKFPGIAKTLSLDATLIETLCLAHDIGHPPFGHGGEIALHYMMHKHGGFEGNGQTFRIISKLEPYTAEHGMNLCRRSVLGLVKYPNFLDTLHGDTITPSQPTSFRKVKADEWHPPKGIFRCDEPLFDWMLAPFSLNDKDRFMRFISKSGAHCKTLFKSFDCSIMELSDDIAYGIHDLEDAIVMDMVHKHHFINDVTLPLKSLDVPWLSDTIEALTDKLFSAQHHERKNAIGALVNSFITAIEIQGVEGFEHPLLAFNATMPRRFAEALELFKRFVFRRVIQRPDVQLLEYKGQLMVMELFEVFASDPTRLLPENTQVRWRNEQDNGNGMRVLADYISGMTDEFATRLYASIFSPKQGGIQDSFQM